MAANQTSLTASPTTVAVNGTVTLTWSGIPKSPGAVMRLIGPYFDAIEVLDLYTNTSWQYQPPVEGSYTAEIQQHNRVLALATFTATP